ncbi:MAG: hypothetical protein ACO1RT_05920 [Planctomycetaceae bacterium]
MLERKLAHSSPAPVNATAAQPSRKVLQRGPAVPEESPEGLRSERIAIFPHLVSLKVAI